MPEPRSLPLRIWDAVSSWWTPVAILVFAAVTMAVIWGTPVLTGTFGDSGWIMPLEVLSIVTGGMLFAWFLASGRIGIRAKKIAVGLVAVVGVAGLLSIRKIEQNGNNIPVIHWRWTKTTEEKLAATHRLTQGSYVAKTAIDDAALEGASCPGFLGANRDGIVEVADLTFDWESKPPKELWRFPVGGGYAAFATKGRIGVTIEQQGPNEVVSAYDALTGEPIWARTYEARFTESMGGDGPRATPTIAGDHVYSLGATGILSCIELKTGKEIWSRDILKDAEAKNIIWGMSGSPLVVEDLLIVNPGGEKGHGLVAYGRHSGKLAWSGGHHKAAYSSPVLATLGGVRQVLIFDQDGIAGHDLANGKELWRHEFKVVNGINVANPLVLPGDRVFISASYGGGCAMLQVKQNDGKWTVDKLWDSPTVMRCKFTSPVYVDGYIYGLDDGVLACIDAETGKRAWKKGRYGHGQIVYAGKQIFVQCEDGNFAVVEANPRAFHELAKLQVLPGNKNWNAPAMAGNRLLVRNHYEMAGYDLPKAK